MAKRVIKSSRSHLEQWDRMQPVLQDYADQLNIDIDVTNPHGESSPIRSEEGKLFLRFWSAPKQTPKFDYPQVFGREIGGGQRDGVKPTGDGQQLIDENGVVVGEIHEGTLYILFDLPHSGTDAGDILELIMKEYARMTGADGATNMRPTAAVRDRNNNDFEIDERSNFCCGDYQRFAQNIKKFAVGMVATDQRIIFHFSMDRVRNENDGRLHVYFTERSQRRGDCIVKEEGRLKAQYERGQKYLVISGLSGCPDGTQKRDAQELLKQILPQILESDPAKIEALANERIAAEEAKLVKQWVDLNMKGLDERISRANNRVKEEEGNTRNYQQKVVNSIRATAAAKLEVKFLTEQRPQASVRFEQELQKLRELPHVKRVDIDNRKVSVFTDRIYIQHKGRQYDIGDFRIEIYPAGDNDGVRMFNLTRQINGYQDGMHHPHITNNGVACFGNIQEAVPALIAEYEYSVLTILCIQYLQSVNIEDGAGKHIVSWPSTPIQEGAQAAA